MSLEINHINVTVSDTDEDMVCVRFYNRSFCITKEEAEFLKTKLDAVLLSFDGPPAQTPP